MKPHRIRMTHDLLINCDDIYKHLSIYRPPRATLKEMKIFHDERYLDFLKRVTPEMIAESSKLMHRCTMCFYLNVDNVGEDCPVFEGLFEYCQISAGGSIGIIFS